MTMNNETLLLKSLLFALFCEWWWCAWFWFTDEQEAVQKRTFTKWINSHLAKVRVYSPLLLPVLFCLLVLTNTGTVVVDWKCPPSHCLLLPFALLFHASCDVVFQNTAELVMGPSVPAKTSHTVFPHMPLFLFVCPILNSLWHGFTLFLIMIFTFQHCVSIFPWATVSNLSFLLVWTNLDCSG